MKRLLSTVLGVLLCMLPLSTFISADVPNDVDGSFTVDFIDYYYGQDVIKSVDINHTVPFGEIQYLRFQLGNEFESTVNSAWFIQNMTITLDEDVLMYIVTPQLQNDNAGFNYGWLDDYRQSVNDFTSTVSNPTAYRFYYELTGDTVTKSSFTQSSVNVEYHCFYNVPAGNYNFSFTYQFSNPDGDPLTYSYPVGVFFVSLDFDPVGDYKSGKIDFGTAVEQINVYIESTIDNGLSSTDEKIFTTVYAQYLLDELVLESDIKYNSAVRDMTDDTSAIIDDFVSGNVDVKDAITDMQMVYFNVLSQSVTAEQGSYASAVYNSSLTELQLHWEQSYKDELDSVIPDEDIQHMQDMRDEVETNLQLEQEVLGYFDLSAYESQLQFEVWFESLPDNYVLYRAIFEKLFEDNVINPFQQFLVVPFSLVLVSVLLATSAIVIKRGRHDG